MRSINKLVLVALAALAALAMSAVSASADTGVIEEDGLAITGSEHVVVSLSAGNSLFETPLGTITCNQVVSEGTIDEPNVNGPTEVGNVTSLDFLSSGSQNCPTSIFGVSTCNPTVDVPIDVVLDPNNPGPALLVFVDQEVQFVCASILGQLNCHYASSEVTGEIVDGTNTAVFDDHLELTAGGGLCPSEGVFEATLQLEDENTNPITYESTK